MYQLVYNQALTRVGSGKDLKGHPPISRSRYIFHLRIFKINIHRLFVNMELAYYRAHYKALKTEICTLSATDMSTLILNDMVIVVDNWS